MLKIELETLTKAKSSLFISVLFLALFIYYILNEKFRLWYISIIFVLFYFYHLKNKQFIKPNISLIIFCSISILTCTLSYYVLDRFENIPNQGYLKTYKRLIDQYFWFIAFMTLPTVFYYNKFTPKIFYNILLIVCCITFFYVSYFNILLEFNRGDLSQFFNPIISYDITLISLSILTLCYSFYLKSKSSYLFLALSLLSMFTLILHGTRGTWLALPFIYSFIFLLYFKQQSKKCFIFLAAVLMFIVINISLTNSPLKNRISDLNNDTALIKNQSYQNSTGTRLVLWKSGIELFKTKPILGISLYGIEANNCKLAKQGKIPECYQHLHSIYFNELAAHGILGLLGLLVTLLIPFFFFIKDIFCANEKIKMLAISGSVFTFFYAVCGLTEYYLFFLSTTFIYFLVVATLMSFIIIEKLHIRNSHLESQ